MTHPPPETLAGPLDVLLVIAHPDDEAFASGTLCLLADKGLRIGLVCVTDGEGGSDELLPSAQGLDLGQIRRRELALSAAMLGIGEVTCLGLPDVEDPAGAGEGAWDQPGLTAALARTIRETAPALVLTHGPLGGYGNAAHRLVHDGVMAAALEARFAGSIFSFCGQVPGGFFSWHFDQPSEVVVDARGYLRRRAASLSYHQSQLIFFVQPAFPRSLRKYLSALFGYVFQLTEAGRKRVPIGTATRFFRRLPLEGFALQKAPDAGRPHFFLEHCADDRRIRTGR